MVNGPVPARVDALVRPLLKPEEVVLQPVTNANSLSFNYFCALLAITDTTGKNSSANFAP